jgi:DUF1680 family protein
MSIKKYRRLAPGSVRLLPGVFQERFNLNRDYLIRLRSDNLLQGHHIEAGLGSRAHPRVQLRNTMYGHPRTGDGYHWGWESPTSNARGHFLGHWLSAAARVYASTGDAELKLRADNIVSELGRCQDKNGGGWVGSIPERLLLWSEPDDNHWAPHYVLHKTLMGLYDMYSLAGSEQALEIADNFADWFHRWTGQLSREQMDDKLDVETGGMLEAWADLYGATGKRKYLDLIVRYTRSRLFEPLLDGQDPLTNQHANTTIPEVHGAARAYEVTGDERWRRIVEAYWDCAVTNRGTYCTGGQTSGEVWTPPFEFATSRGDRNQEHCTVYNMIRLADYLFRWTGDVAYADYIERNLYNGVLAQQHPRTGMISYFLPLAAGGTKTWGSPTYDFWCCHGTLVQAHASHNAWVYYENDETIAICQYIPSVVRTERDGMVVAIEQTTEHLASGGADDSSSAIGSRHRSTIWAVDVSVSCQRPVEFTLKLRMPWWTTQPATVVLNGEAVPGEKPPSSFFAISRKWNNDTIRLELPMSLTVSEIPDEPETVAFLDGPVVLAGLCREERVLTGNRSDPSSFLIPDNELELGRPWRSGYHTIGQQLGLRFRPLCEIADEPYTLYFPIQRSGRD